MRQGLAARWPTRLALQPGAEASLHRMLNDPAGEAGLTAVGTSGQCPHQR